MSWNEHDPIALNVHLNQCPCCGAALCKWATIGGFQLERCEGCRSAHVNPRPALETLKKYYASAGHGENTASSVHEVLRHEEKYPNSTLDARRILSNVEGMAPGSRLLDIGCGYGFYCQEALKLGFDVDAIEISAFERQCARELADIEPHATTFEEFKAKGNSYDAILMSQILEHAIDVRGWIAKARKLLVPGGVLAVAVPNFNSFLGRLLGTADPMLQPPDHLNYFNLEGLALLLEREGLAIRLSETVSRIPGTAVTRRLPVPSRFELPIQRLVQRCQRPLLRPVDKLGYGMFLNTYAIKTGTL